MNPVSSWPWLGDFVDGRGAEPERANDAWPAVGAVIVGIFGTVTSQREVLEKAIDFTTVELFAPVVVPSMLTVMAAYVFMARRKSSPVLPVDRYVYGRRLRGSAKVVHVILAILTCLNLPTLIPRAPTTVDGYLCSPRGGKPIGNASVTAQNAAGGAVASAARLSSEYDGHFRVEVSSWHLPVVDLGVMLANGDKMSFSLDGQDIGTGCSGGPPASGIKGHVLRVHNRDM